MRLLRSFLRDESGSNVIEYGLIAAMISISAISGMTAVGDQVIVFFNDMVTAFGR